MSNVALREKLEHFKYAAEDLEILFIYLFFQATPLENCRPQVVSVWDSPSTLGETCVAS